MNKLIYLTFNYHLHENLPSYLYRTVLELKIFNTELTEVLESHREKEKHKLFSVNSMNLCVGFSAIDFIKI